jgi:predicted ester cyclase
MPPTFEPNGSPLPSAPQPAGHPVNGSNQAGPGQDRGGQCTAPQLRRFIKSRPYVPMHELRRRFGIVGDDDDVTSLADYKAWSKALQVGLPDIRVAIDDLIAEGDMAVKRWTASGTHTGELAGIAPTRRPVRFSGVSIYRFHDGRIAESWYVYDLFGLVQQLTAVTSGNERGTELLNSERSRAQLR